MFALAPGNKPLRGSQTHAPSDNTEAAKGEREWGLGEGDGVGEVGIDWGLGEGMGLGEDCVDWGLGKGMGLELVGIGERGGGLCWRRWWGLGFEERNGVGEGGEDWRLGAGETDVKGRVGEGIEGLGNEIGN